MIKNKDELKRLGILCKCYRKFCGYTLEDVSRRTGYSLSSISAFENGINNNALIYHFYVKYCFERKVGNNDN